MDTSFLKAVGAWAFVPVSLVVLLFVWAACEHIVAPPELQPTLQSIQANIFSEKCARPGCHVPNGAGPMPLRTVDESFDNLVNVPSIQKPNLLRVEPGDPDESYLVLKLEDDDDIEGDRMPLTGSRLSDTEIGTIRTWIEEGAEKN